MLLEHPVYPDDPLGGLHVVQLLPEGHLYLVHLGTVITSQYHKYIVHPTIAFAPGDCLRSQLNISLKQLP